MERGYHDETCCGNRTYFEPDIELGTGQKLRLIGWEHTSERRASSYYIDRITYTKQRVKTISLLALLYRH
jgi:hypothetical protein